VTFWEPSPDFSTDVNAMITGPPSYPKEDLRVIRESWNLDRVYQAFYRNYGLGRKSGWLPIWARTATGRTVLDSVIRHAIHEHPDRYAKFVLSMAKQFFFRNITHDVDPYEKVSRRNYMSLMGRQHHLRKLRRLPPHPFVDQMRKAYGEFFDKSASNLEEIPTGNTRRLRPIYRSATKPHQILLSAGTHLFRHVAWVVMSLGTFLAAVVVLARRRGRDVRAFFVMLLGAVAIAAGLLTCLGELAFPRFNLPVAFIFFLAPFPLPGLWLGHGIDAAAAPPANERPDPR